MRAVGERKSQQGGGRESLSCRKGWLGDARARGGKGIITALSAGSGRSLQQGQQVDGRPLARQPTRSGTAAVQDSMIRTA